MENAINQFGSRSPSTVQLPQGALDLHQGHKVMINLAQDLLTTSQLFSTIYNLIVQVWGSSLPLPSSLIMHPHNLRIILKAVCSSCRTNALHARLAVVIELHQLSNTQSLTALLSISFRHYFLNIMLILVLF